MKAKRLSKAQQLSLDIITTLPQTIIEIILCLLPIDEAARTSTLSKEWRYKWTRIPKFVYYEYRPYERQTDKLLRVIHQVMLQRQDPIQEFTLYISDVHLFSKVGHYSREMDQIILNLSRNHTVKKLALEFDETSYNSYNLPLSFFSLHHLTELSLRWCDVYRQPIFNGFGSLTTLSLNFVRISSKTLLHLLSNGPSLKSFNLAMIEENIIGDEKSTMIELFECLPVIEHLTIWRDAIALFVPDLFPKELPTLLVHLKYFCLEGMSFHDGYGLDFLALLIKSSPNLEKIELWIDSNEYEKYHSDVWLEHLSEVWLEHLIELQIVYIRKLDPELEFVKFILARSPKLKKFRIQSMVEKDQESEMLKTLLRAPRASAVVIDVF
ncbi:F-box/FBD/LRR-repeat protein At1g13570-like [Bidens hawaiensis]|uniref:F-box/FBD/LRR-repeat protein At1g13570-like n=1 Tax=Bidens hawaiensis TaxID=980011 RepID=UPI00404B255B